MLLTGFGGANLAYFFFDSTTLARIKTPCFK